MSHDAIVIGAGHNGLIAACELVKAGRRVLLLEKNAILGAAAAGYDLVAGYRAPRFAHLLHALHPEIEQRLNLQKHGLIYARRDLPTVALAEDGKHVIVDNQSVRGADGAPHADAAAFLELRQRLQRYAGLLSRLLLKPPPQFGGMDWRDAAGLAKLGLDMRWLGKDDMREFLRVILSNASDVILDELPDGPLAGALALDAVLGGHVGPRSPGTVLSLLYRLAQGGGRQLPKGGMGAFSDALAKAAESRGVEIRREAAVAEILVENDAVRGVRLDSDETLSASLVLSSLDAPTTLCLTGVEHFDAEAARRIRNVRCRGVTAKVNLALTGLPAFTGLERRDMEGRLVLAPGVGALESAFNAAKYGELPELPALEMVLPSLSDDSLVAGEGQILSVVVQYAPYHLQGGWNDEARDALGESVLSTLERYAPGLRRLLHAIDVVTPLDIERVTGATGGHWHHGELTVDQMLMLRPVNGMGGYALPVGDIIGAAGHNAAQRALQVPRRAASRGGRKA